MVPSPERLGQESFPSSGARGASGPSWLACPALLSSAHPHALCPLSGCAGRLLHWGLSVALRAA